MAKRRKKRKSISLMSILAVGGTIFWILVGFFIFQQMQASAEIDLQTLPTLVGTPSESSSNSIVFSNTIPTLEPQPLVTFTPNPNQGVSFPTAIVLPSSTPTQTPTNTPVVPIAIVRSTETINFSTGNVQNVPNVVAPQIGGNCTINRGQIDRVLVVSMDGVRPDALQNIRSPNIGGLLQRGAVSWTARTVFPPVTVPSHVSMLTGLDVAEHGVDWNDNKPTKITQPTFLSIAQQAGYRTAMVVGKEKLHQVRNLSSIAYISATGGDHDVTDRTIEYISQGYQVIFAHFPNPDVFGHTVGWMSQKYIDELYVSDWQLGRILQHIDNSGLRDRMLIIVTSDHGGNNKTHGENIPEDMLIPWVIVGPNVIGGKVITNPVSVADTAHTVLATLGLPLPQSSLGKPIYEAFQGC